MAQYVTALQRIRSEIFLFRACTFTDRQASKCPDVSLLGRFNALNEQLFSLSSGSGSRFVSY